jgi:4-carboxymuconolactone decarboxylase
MRLPIAVLCAFAIGLAVAQAPVPDLHLRGDRFKPLTYDKLTPEQKAMADHLLAGERGGMNGPFNVTLRSPEVGDAAQKLGALVRFHSSLPKKLNEMAIIMTGRFWNAQYEWYAHKKLALEAGLSPAIVDAIAAGKRPTGMQPDETAIYNFVNELLQKKEVSDASFAAVTKLYGEKGAVDLTSVMGYYCFVSLILDIDRYPLPDGAKPELKLLKN